MEANTLFIYFAFLLHLSIVIIRLVHTDNSYNRNVPVAFDHILMEGTIPPTQPNVVFYFLSCAREPEDCHMRARRCWTK